MILDLPGQRAGLRVVPGGIRIGQTIDALAWSAARWTADQALTAGASVICVEDVRSMEARGMGRTLNTRLSQQVRGQNVERMRHLAAEAGIVVVTVPARNTSRHAAPAASSRCANARPPPVP
jgi:transposase